MGRLKIRSGWVEFFGNNHELHWQVTIKVGFAPVWWPAAMILF
jgi:hypothetical protein